MSSQLLTLPQALCGGPLPPLPGLSSAILPSLALSLLVTRLFLEYQAQCCLEAFVTAVPAAWNSLSLDLQAADCWALGPQLTCTLPEKAS